MRGAGGALPTVEARHRSAGPPDDMNKRSQRSNDFKDTDKTIYTSIQDRSSSCKLRSLKLVLVVIVCGTFMTLLHSPGVYDNEHFSPTGSRLRSIGIGWTFADSRYASHLEVSWDRISKIVEQLAGSKSGELQIGLLNFNDGEINQWKQSMPGANSIALHLEHAQKNITWEALYPEWIDEEEEEEVPVCPSLPEPDVPEKSQLDLIAVKLPCRKLGNWSRDVARLHLQLAAAKLATSVKGQVVHVLIVTDCFPIPNLFTCKELVLREGNTWLYKPNLRVMQQKLWLPVGSCELAIPHKAKDRSYVGSVHREAYATILHSADMYVCGAIAAGQSIRLVGSKRDLVILVDETISEYHRGGLEAAGWKIRTIQRIRNPKAERDAYNEWNYSKFRLWQLTDYDKIIFIDADLLILRNIDFLFGMPEISATGNNATLFNSGVMVIEPSNCTFQLLMEHINEIESYNGGDQGYLNEIFTWWRRIPRHMNFLKHFWIGDEEEKKQQKTRLFGANPPVLYVLHYLGNKPWMCYRDYDCNWNVDFLQEFASDVAHEKWWKVHDTMPYGLQKFCLLESRQKAGLEWDRRQAEKANYTDGHWRREIKDGRLITCIDEYCLWESMLSHWGETNWTDDGVTAVPRTPSKVLKVSLSGL
ncbi:putative UDP-glucuronate:xylan alpha-glucuronosyltransferase 3 [Magnolia sinica]|uniref:putative UDP-glucuronate:xylan alpha-glucuronosyltransferase 3 n=1 Tax=Magnolia sinica TaxID=86752 RepID=UPI0026580DDD|nr:putative UDP-glucuronate:xylan alpha-glucuronosyltransferase 3 [Magnolia sinica]XP_058089733.1 putative UDP-glucuronate:xylan alpha-glucuronosyltransferase 3 [Magnolia sinica]XP_058089734.1 putative UDP-glucuronate:xylan alpha-glucuronosyltransferase 3 [Magnolia sinica]